MKKLALFDFDGTLTINDSLLEFIKFYKGSLSFYLGFFLASPVLVLYKLKIIPNWKAKEFVLRYFFKGERKDLFDQKARLFAMDHIPQMLRQEAFKKLQWHQKNGHEVVVVTASAVSWIKPWTDKVGVDLVATELEVKENELTGKIAGKNCYGGEKVSRICSTLNIKDYSEVYVYGDSPGDKELLALATHPFYRTF